MQFKLITERVTMKFKRITQRVTMQLEDVHLARVFGLANVDALLQHLMLDDYQPDTGPAPSESKFQPPPQTTENTQGDRIPRLL